MKITASAALVAASMVLAASSAFAATALTARNGMTVYTYDKDKGAAPSCFGLCAVAWPPYMGSAGEKLGKGWSLVKRNGQTMQWAYHNHPVYFYFGDHKKGDMTGNGKGGVWHVVMR